MENLPLFEKNHHENEGNAPKSKRSADSPPIASGPKIHSRPIPRDIAEKMKEALKEARENRNKRVKGDV